MVEIGGEKLSEKIWIDSDILEMSDIHLKYIDRLLTILKKYVKSLGQTTYKSVVIYITDNEIENEPNARKNTVGEAYLTSAMNNKEHDIHLMEANFKDPNYEFIVQYLILHEFGHIITNKNVMALEEYKQKLDSSSQSLKVDELSLLGLEALQNEVDADNFAFEQLELNGFDLTKFRDFFEQQKKKIIKSYNDLLLDPIQRIRLIEEKIYL